MSIAFWKTFLALAKTVAVVILVGAAVLFWSHRRTMAEQWKAPDFSPPARHATGVVAQTGNLALQLGRFQREKPVDVKASEPEAPPPFETELAKLGEITDAIVVYPPYEEGGLAPAIIFKYRVRPPTMTEDSRTIRLGESLVEKQNPESKHHPIAIGFRFVGCERDPANPASTFFLFDVKCDGKDIQKARWKLEEPVKTLPSAEGGPAAPSDINSDKIFVGPTPTFRKPEDAAAKSQDPVATEPVQTPPVAAEPPPGPLEVEEEPAGTLFQQEEGVYAPTADGIDYLERNYEEILKQTRTETAADGVRIVNFSNAALANQFGIQKGDVILKINGTPVRDQSHAVSVIKQVLKTKGSSPILRVTIRRRGAERELKFDTRDPATRRAAKKAFK
jgi:hypothetical protein